MDSAAHGKRTEQVVEATRTTETQHSATLTETATPSSSFFQHHGPPVLDSTPFVYSSTTLVQFNKKKPDPYRQSQQRDNKINSQAFDTAHNGESKTSRPISFLSTSLCLVGKTKDFYAAAYDYGAPCMYELVRSGNQVRLHRSLGTTSEALFQRHLEPAPEDASLVALLNLDSWDGPQTDTIGSVALYYKESSSATSSRLEEKSVGLNLNFNDAPETSSQNQAPRQAESFPIFSGCLPNSNKTYLWIEHKNKRITFEPLREPFGEHHPRIENESLTNKSARVNNSGLGDRRRHSKSKKSSGPVNSQSTPSSDDRGQDLNYFNRDCTPPPDCENQSDQFDKSVVITHPDDVNPANKKRENQPESEIIAAYCGEKLLGVYCETASIPQRKSKNVAKSRGYFAVYSDEIDCIFSEQPKVKSEPSENSDATITPNGQDSLYSSNPKIHKSLNICDSKDALSLNENENQSQKSITVSALERTGFDVNIEQAAIACIFAYANIRNDIVKSVFNVSIPIRPYSSLDANSQPCSPFCFFCICCSLKLLCPCLLK